jgi:beta-lactamase regulating signal transducer with metallopeptidase domain
MAIETLNDVAAAWSAAVLRASVQGGLAIAAAWLLVRCRPGLPARVACWVWRLADLKLIVALVWTAPLLLPLLPPARLAKPIAGPATAERPAKQVDIVSRHMAMGSTPHPSPPPQRGRESWNPFRQGDPGFLCPPSLRGRVRVGGAAPAKDVKENCVQVLGDPAPQAPRAGQLARASHVSVTVALLLGWLGGVVAILVIIGRDALAVRRLRCSCRPIDSPALRAAAAELARVLGLRTVPELRCGAGVARPMLVGAFRPAILLPPAWLAAPRSAAEVPAVLAHELAHVRRRDLAWSGLAGLARCLFFFHPLVWLAHREALMAREAACDAMALAASGVGRAEYARILLNFAAARPPGHVRSLASLGMAGSAGARSLKRRLKAMKHDQNLSRRRLLSWTLALLVIGAAAIVPWKLVPRAALAQDKESPSKAAVSRRAESAPAPSAETTDQARIRAAEARVEAARAEQKVAEAIVRRDEAEVARATATRQYRAKEYNRYLDLLKRGAIPRELVDEHESRLGEAQAAAHEAEARLASARFGLEAAAASIREAEILRDINRISSRMRTGSRPEDELKKAEARLLAARLDRARAERDAARDDIERAESNLEKARAKVEWSSKNARRLKALAMRGAIEQRLADKEERALARVRDLEQFAENAIELSRARLEAAEARLEAVKAGGPWFDPLFPPAPLPR